jgi:hypothetical protein
LPASSAAKVERPTGCLKLVGSAIPDGGWEHLPQFDREMIIKSVPRFEPTDGGSRGRHSRRFLYFDGRSPESSR